MNTDDVQFGGHHGDRLSGTIHRADEPRGSILLTHCFNGSISSLGLPLAVIHSTDDGVVPISEGERIFALPEQPKMFMPVIGGGHLLAGGSAAHFAADATADWFDATAAGDLG